MVTDFSEKETVKARYFATVDKGQIVTIAEAIPDHELLENQFALTEQEYALLHCVRKDFFELAKIIELAQSVQAKIKANGS